MKPPIPPDQRTQVGSDSAVHVLADILNAMPAQQRAQLRSVLLPAGSRMDLLYSTPPDGLMHIPLTVSVMCDPAATQPLLNMDGYIRTLSDLRPSVDTLPDLVAANS